MKKQTLLLSLFILLGFSEANCQTPDWVWARSGKSSSGNLGEGWSVATDKSNNVYVMGLYQGTIAFGSIILPSTANSASYLAKYDASGNVQWAKTAVNGVSGNSRGYNVCTDALGNVYITGFFSGTVSFDTYTLATIGSSDIFLVKYDSTGNVIWAKSAGGTSADQGTGVSTDRSGNVYVTGYFGSPTITFGSYTLTNAGFFDIFLAKYDSSGNVQWAKSAGGSSFEYVWCIATDALANVYITGHFLSPAITFGSYVLNNAGNVNIFLTKYDSSGNVLWAKSSGGTGGRWVAADSSGNAYLTGDYASPSISFGSYTLTNAGQKDAFLVKYDSSGNVRWAKSIGGTGDEWGYCVATDKSDKIYVTGSFTSTVLTLDTIIVQRPSVYNDPMYVAGYDSSGRVLFAKALGSGGDDQNAIATSPSGCIYIGGDFYNVNPFIIGNDSLHKSGLEDVFVAKLCYPQVGESVPEITPIKEFILYPNPFDDKLNVASPPAPLQRRGEEEELTLFDVFGRVLLHRSFTNSATINTEQLACGIYFYEVKDKDGVGARGKLVKNEK